MGDSCRANPHSYPPSCAAVRGIAARALRRRAPHGREVSGIASKYFELIAHRVKPEPELSLAYALTTSLAFMHHLRGSGKDQEETERILKAMEKGIPGIPTFQGDLGVEKDEFLALLRMLRNQYAILSSNSYDYNRDARIGNYSDLILSGGASLPALIARIADYCLDEEKWKQGAPSPQELEPATRRMLSVKMLKVYFPLADMFGWLDAAHTLRENGLNWDPELADKLTEMKERMKPLIPLYTLAAPELGKLMTAASSTGSAEGMPLHRYQEVLSQAVVQRCRPKTVAAVVLKMDEKGKLFEEIMDMVAARIVMACEPGTVRAIGNELYEMLKGRGFKGFTTHDFNDYYRYPKPSGYQAIHITGYMPFMGIHVPCEMQLMDVDSYLDSCCGRSGRLVYKSGVSLDDQKKIDAFNELLRPVSAAAADIRGAIELPVQTVGNNNGRETRTFSVYMAGRKKPKPVELYEGASVADVAFDAMGGPYRALIFVGRSKGGTKVGRLNVECPQEIFVDPAFIDGKKQLIPRPVAKALKNDPKVGEAAKRMLINSF